MEFILNSHSPYRRRSIGPLPFFLSVSSQNIMNDKFGLQVTKAMYIIVA